MIQDYQELKPSLIGRKRTKTLTKWTSRAKKIFNSWKYIRVPIKGIKCDPRGWGYFAKTRYAESFKDYMENSKFAKKLRKTPKDRTYVYEQVEAHRKVKKSREDAKRKIREGIKEYDDRYSESFCSECMNFNTKDCPFVDQVYNATNWQEFHCPNFFS